MNETYVYKGKTAEEIFAERCLDDFRMVQSVAVKSLDNAFIIVRRTMDNIIILNGENWTEEDRRGFISFMCNHYWKMRLYSVSENIYFLI